MNLLEGCEGQRGLPLEVTVTLLSSFAEILFSCNMFLAKQYFQAL
jgi:hypothetical protein